MPDNFIVSFDSGNGKIGDEHCNACLLISTKNKDGTITVLHEYHNKEAVHLHYIINELYGSTIQYYPIKNIVLLEEK